MKRDLEKLYHEGHEIISRHYRLDLNYEECFELCARFPEAGNMILKALNIGFAVGYRCAIAEQKKKDRNRKDKS